MNHITLACICLTLAGICLVNAMRQLDQIKKTGMTDRSYPVTIAGCWAFTTLVLFAIGTLIMGKIVVMILPGIAIGSLFSAIAAVLMVKNAACNSMKIKVFDQITVGDLSDILFYAWWRLLPELCQMPPCEHGKTWQEVVTSMVLSEHDKKQDELEAELRQILKERGVTIELLCSRAGAESPVGTLSLVSDHGYLTLTRLVSNRWSLAYNVLHTAEHQKTIEASIQIFGKYQLPEAT